MPSIHKIVIVCPKLSEHVTLMCSQADIRAMIVNPPKQLLDELCEFPFASLSVIR